MVGRRARVTRPSLFVVPVADRQRVDARAASPRRHPRRLETFVPGIVAAAGRHVDAVGPDAPTAGAAVEHRAEHTTASRSAAGTATRSSRPPRPARPCGSPKEAVVGDRRERRVQRCRARADRARRGLAGLADGGGATTPSVRTWGAPPRRAGPGLPPACPDAPPASPSPAAASIGDLRPHRVEQFLDRAPAFSQRQQQAVLAVDAVGEVVVQLRPRVPNGRPVARTQHIESSRTAQARERQQVPDMAPRYGLMKTLPSPSTASPVKQAPEPTSAKWSAACPGVATASNGPKRVPSDNSTLTAPASCRQRRRMVSPAGHRVASLWSWWSWVSTTPPSPPRAVDRRAGSRVRCALPPAAPDRPPMLACDRRATCSYPSTSAVPGSARARAGRRSYVEQPRRRTPALCRAPIGIPPRLSGLSRGVNRSCGCDVS